MTLNGTAGAAGNDAGVFINLNSSVNSYGGAISITGYGGSGSDSRGVSIGQNSTVDAYGGPLSIMGTGGPLGSASHGVALGNDYGGGIATITSAGGSVQITGIGGGDNTTGDTSKGVITFYDTVSISGGTVTINGTAGFGDDAVQLGDTPYGSTVIAATSAATIVSGGAFKNYGGSGAVSVSGGRWLIYAASPSNVIKGGLVPTLYQYNTAYEGTVAPTGSGFIYVSPLRVDANFTGTLSSAFGSTPSATPGYLLAGLDSSDTTTAVAVTGAASYSNWPIGVSTAAGSYALQYTGGFCAPTVSHTLTLPRGARPAGCERR